jgi:hypothetical protein
MRVSRNNDAIFFPTGLTINNKAWGIVDRIVFPANFGVFHVFVRTSAAPNRSAHIRYCALNIPGTYSRRLDKCHIEPGTAALQSGAHHYQTSDLMILNSFNRYLQ